MKGLVEIISRTERRRKLSDAEKAAILAEADEDSVSVRQVAECHEIGESLILLRCALTRRNFHPRGSYMAPSPEIAAMDVFGSHKQTAEYSI